MVPLLHQADGSGTQVSSYRTLRILGLPLKELKTCFHAIQDCLKLKGVSVGHPYVVLSRDQTVTLTPLYPHINRRTVEFGER